MLVQESSSLCNKVREIAGNAAPASTQPALDLISGTPAVEMKSALLVSPLSEDHQSLGQIFLRQGWTLHRTRTLESALDLLRKQPVPVVITERDLPLGDWRDLLVAIQQLPRSPLLVVTCRIADEYLWAEVLNLGGRDVVAKPFRAAEVHWVLESAWRIRANTQEEPMTSAKATMRVGSA